jgi:hypothetical protein
MEEPRFSNSTDRCLITAQNSRHARLISVPQGETHAARRNGNYLSRRTLRFLNLYVTCMGSAPLPTSPGPISLAWQPPSIRFWSRAF